jgi:hypothetical protein
MHEFDASNRNRGTPKSLEPEHRTLTNLDGSAVLFNQIVEVLGRSQLNRKRNPTAADQLRPQQFFIFFA